MYLKNKTLTSVRALPLLSQKPTNLQLLYGVQIFATINSNASAKFVFVGISIILPHIIGSPVYITHCASNISPHGFGEGQPCGVGHGVGVVNIVS